MRACGVSREVFKQVYSGVYQQIEAEQQCKQTNE
jgi:hypothetical protein